MTLVTKMIDSAEDMMELGGRIAGKVAPPFCIHLIGQIGAGKTTFARGFLRSMGINGPVKSPTFTLVETYFKGGIKVNHLDLFRIDSSRELEFMGFDDYLDDKSILLIEWPESARGGLPDPDLTIKIEVEGFSRRIQFDKNLV
tara:strand:- start:857 stop:1285 length:429 start_codon:yes stop_codon:yes gene_type:complete